MVMFNNTFYTRLNSSGSFWRGGICYWLSPDLKDNIPVLSIGHPAAASLFPSYFDDEYEGMLSCAGEQLSPTALPPRAQGLQSSPAASPTHCQQQQQQNSSSSSSSNAKSCDAFLHPVLWGCVRPYSPAVSALQGKEGFLSCRATCLCRQPNTQPQGELKNIFFSSNISSSPPPPPVILHRE